MRIYWMNTFHSRIHNIYACERMASATYHLLIDLNIFYPRKGTQESNKQKNRIESNRLRALRITQLHLLPTDYESRLLVERWTQTNHSNTAAIVSSTDLYISVAEWILQYYELTHMRKRNISMRLLWKYLWKPPMMRCALQSSLNNVRDSQQRNKNFILVLNNSVWMLLAAAASSSWCMLFSCCINNSG